MTLIRRERPGMSEDELAADGAIYWREWHEVRGYRNPDWLEWWANRRIREDRKKRQAPKPRTQSGGAAKPAEPETEPYRPPERKPAQPVPQFVLDKQAELRAQREAGKL